MPQMEPGKGGRGHARCVLWLHCLLTPFSLHVPGLRPAARGFLAEAVFQRDPRRSG